MRVIDKLLITDSKSSLLHLYILSISLEITFGIYLIETVIAPVFTCCGPPDIRAISPNLPQYLHNSVSLGINLNDLRVIDPIPNKTSCGGC